MEIEHRAKSKVPKVTKVSKGGLLKGLIDTLRKPNVVQTVKLIVVIVLLLIALANRDVDFIIATLAGII